MSLGENWLKARTMMTDGYTTTQVSEITGFSIRQLDYWARTGMLSPSIKSSDGPGTRRCYSFDDLVRLSFIQRLREAAWSTQKIRKALAHLQEFTSDGSGLEYVSIIADKKHILALCVTEEKQQVLVDILNPNGQQVLWIVLESLRGETRRNTQKLLHLSKLESKSVAIAM